MSEREHDLHLLSMPERTTQLAVAPAHLAWRRTYALAGAAVVFLAPTVYLAVVLQGALWAVLPALATSTIGTMAATGTLWAQQRRTERVRARRALKRFIGVDLDCTMSRAQFLEARRGRH